MSAATTYAIRCDEYQTRGYRTREVAEDQIAQLEALGACHLPHEVVEVEADG